MGDLSGGAGMGNGARQLRCQRDQEGLFLVTKATQFLLPDNQHAKDLAMLDNGHTQEAVKPLFAGLAGKPVAGMGRCILEIHRFLAFTDHADDAFMQIEAHIANCILVQSLRCT